MDLNRRQYLEREYLLPKLYIKKLREKSMRRGTTENRELLAILEEELL